ncbi:MAG TPA: purine-binding chemotaxis protein CheW [Thiotrichales bacterium]|nr:purine-binding chemotaxis protein CheW [Thiotrichales bacterium]
MLCLVLQPGEERYLLDAGTIVEIVPFVHLKPLPHAPAWVAGLFDYRGEAVPVIDLTLLLGGRPSRALLTTRIVIVDYPLPGGGSHPLGLLSEQVMETVRIADEEFMPAGVEVPDAPWLGPVTRRADGLEQRVEVTELLPDEVRELLFTECA